MRTLKLRQVRFCFEASACPRASLRTLFYSNFNAGVAFEELPCPPLDASCCLTLALEPNSIYTLSTVSASKGSHPIDAIVPVERQAASCGSVCCGAHTKHALLWTSFGTQILITLHHFSTGGQLDRRYRVRPPVRDNLRAGEGLAS